MNKETYLKWRDAPEPPWELYYEYYKEKRAPEMELLSFDAFIMPFQQFLTSVEIIQTETGIKYINWNNILNKIYTHFNKKFEE